ncbi:MAG: hypothetical protein DI536_16295 [Archangium gephyra]|uniref:Response regulatory domain-containing protein n=1 Tax=Archangium gephyra TaxID=48 RepID=A0A2W5TF80_9BACT|nr:MAG: hypothetical protein DI536_16295 [Archangium gephyra]
MPLQVIVVESGTLLSRALARVFRAARPEVVSLRDPSRIGDLLLTVRADVIVVEERCGLHVLEVARALQPDARRYVLVAHVAAPDERRLEHEAVQPCTALTESWLEGLLLECAVSPPRIASVLDF